MPQNPFIIPLRQMARVLITLRPVLIDQMGAEALKFIDDNFAKQGFQGESFQPWKKLKKQPKGKQRKILVDTAELRRSPKQTNFSDRVEISSDVPYAQIHNEGGVITHNQRAVILSYRKAKGGKLRLTKTGTEAQLARVKERRVGYIYAHSHKMPARPFAKPSPVLFRACEKVILTNLIQRLNTL